MIAQKKGHIVALCSIAGLAGLKNLAPYCSSKFAVRGYMEALSEELRHTTPVSYKDNAYCTNGEFAHRTHLSRIRIFLV